MNSNDSNQSNNEPNKPFTPYNASQLSQNSNPDTTQKDKNFSQKERAEDKIREQLRFARESKNNDEIFDFAKNNKEQMITYLLLGLGIVLMMFMYGSLLGELIIGMVVGYHFASEIVFYLQNVRHFFSNKEQLRSIVLTVILVALFIAAPGIFIGAAIIAAIQQFMPNKGGNRDE
ncbi:hypothetical protein [Candidatus Protochlamydia sp. R18]|uniref:hypothetical protein n=1 Tax=Candidatus Protochlamydia sp. R18 TaxID=1353977 RepID=UPI0005A9B4A9|nr:hypothetical protein [Candidatus Protochlamydia sp. R18]